ncbi:hypothetical protein R1T08_17730 [Streptomyces sp. SBC-4]|nr:hypothetical protein [Streptomyces sp. SBC-4]MDV5145998.1 hypothetical protein [Streptomyces sp. SBC-4]
MDDKEKNDNPAGDDGLGAHPQQTGAGTTPPPPLDDDRNSPPPLPHPVPHAGHDKR